MQILECEVDELDTIYLKTDTGIISISVSGNPQKRFDVVISSSRYPIEAARTEQNMDFQKHMGVNINASL